MNGPEICSDGDTTENLAVAAVLGPAVSLQEPAGNVTWIVPSGNVPPR